MGDETEPLTPTLEPVVPRRVAEDERRRQLWRDSATILIGVVLALLIGQTVFPPAVAGPGSSPTPVPSGINIGTESFGPPKSLPPVQTLGPIVNPSLAIDATPTPIPVITMGPTPTPSPTPNPSASHKPTPKPTTKPSGQAPTPTPDTPAAPEAKFTWSIAGLDVQFDNNSTASTSWEWDFGDGQGSTQQNPTHTYASAGSYSVRLTVYGPGGSSTITHGVNPTGP